MAYFAQIDATQTVLEVIAINNADLENLPFPESEPIGQTYIASIGIEGQWLQTSYMGLFRATFAGIGYTFNALLGEYGEFVAPPIPEPEPEPIEPLA